MENSFPFFFFTMLFRTQSRRGYFSRLIATRPSVFAFLRGGEPDWFRDFTGQQKWQISLVERRRKEKRRSADPLWLEKGLSLGKNWKGCRKIARPTILFNPPFPNPLLIKLERLFWTRDTKFLASNTGIGYSPISEMGTFLIGNAWKLESLGWNEFRTGSARVSAEISPRARCEICRAPAPNFGTRGEFPVAIARWQNYPHIWKLLLVIESFFFLFFLPRKQINLKVRARNLSDRWAILEIMGEKRKKFNRKIGRTKSQIWFPPAGAKFGWKRILTISSLNFLDEFSPPAWSIVHPWPRSGGKIGWMLVLEKKRWPRHFCLQDCSRRTACWFPARCATSSLSARNQNGNTAASTRHGTRPPTQRTSGARTSSGQGNYCSDPLSALLQTDPDVIHI